MRVLLVDDSNTINRLNESVVRQLEGVHCTIATNGVEALDFIDSEEFDLILSDWNMPGLDGLGLLQGVRIRSSSVPFVMVTTECERGQVVQAVAAGANDYLVKPYSKDALLSKVRKWLPTKV